MSEAGLSFLGGLAIGIILSGLGGLIVHALRNFGSTAGLQLGFIIRLGLDILSFLVIYFVYNSAVAYIGLAIGLLSYKNSLFFKAFLASRREKGKE